MSAKVVDFPAMSLERAREIVATPSFFSGGEIVRACKLLFACGTAADVRVVLTLQQLGIVAGFEAPQAMPLRVSRGRKWWVAILYLYVLIAAALGHAVLAYLLVNSIKTVI